MGMKDMVSNTAMLPVKSLGEDCAMTLEQYPGITSQAKDIFQGLEDWLLLDTFQENS